MKPMRLSSKATLVCKIVMPCAIWVCALIALYQVLEQALEGRPVGGTLAGGLLGVFVILWLGWYVFSFQEVFAAEDHLIVRGLVKKATIPYEQIARIDEQCARGSCTVQLTLKQPCEFGSHIRYLGPFFSPAYRETPQTAWLREKCGLTGTGKQEVRSRSNTDTPPLHPPDACLRDPGYRRRRRRRVVLIGGALALPLGGCLAWFIIVEIEHNPTFVDDMRSGAVDAGSIASIDILKHDQGGFTDIAKKARITIAKTEVIEALMTILRDKTTDGSTYRNHPATMYYGILKVNLRDGRFYYIEYTVEYYQGSYYTSFRASAVNREIAAVSPDHENVPLASFVKERDPWYHGINSPGRRTGYRVNYPDTVP